MSSIKSRVVIWRAGITHRTDGCWARIEKEGSGKSLFNCNHNFLNWSKNFTCLLLNLACNWCGQPNFSQDCWNKIVHNLSWVSETSLSDLFHRWARALKRKKKKKKGDIKNCCVCRKWRTDQLVLVCKSLRGGDSGHHSDVLCWFNDTVHSEQAPHNCSINYIPPQKDPPMIANLFPSVYWKSLFLLNLFQINCDTAQGQLDLLPL